VNLAVGWDSWAVTPDYYNACANTTAPNFGIPLNNRGFQNAHTGQAYVGLFTLAAFIPNQREFVGGTLSAPLTIGQQYFVSFWANHADTSLVGLTTDKLGIKFSTVAFNYFATPDTVNNLPHIFSNSIISDTANWVLIQGSFVADSAYTHFGIGNYFDDFQTNQSQIGTGTANYAYYLIDDVCISANSEACTPATGVVKNTLVAPFRIYPNPNHGNFMLVFSDNLQNENATVTISNLLGERLLERIISDKATEILFEQPAGFYFINVSTAKGSNSVKVVIVY
jgi:hypothetical protein